GKHPRMARHAASVASNPHLANFQRLQIEALAAQHGIKFKELDGGRLQCRVTDEAKLLELLDARRYHLDLQGNGGYPYRASARQRVPAWALWRAIAQTYSSVSPASDRHTPPIAAENSLCAADHRIPPVDVKRGRPEYCARCNSRFR